MTFSIVARCARTGMFGVAVSSSSPAVAARCATGSSVVHTSIGWSLSGTSTSSCGSTQSVK